MEFLLKGNVQYSLPPCTICLRSAAFYIETIFLHTSYLIEEVNRFYPSFSMRAPWFKILFFSNKKHSALRKQWHGGGIFGTCSSGIFFSSSIGISILFGGFKSIYEFKKNLGKMNKVSATV
jgi:hypothetical protein